MITRTHRARQGIHWLLPALLARMACLPVVAAAQGPQGPVALPEIHLRAGSFAPARGEALALAAQPAHATSHAAAGVAGQWLVQFRGPVLPEWRQVLTLQGAEFTGGTGFGVVSMALGDGYTDARFDDYRMAPVSGGLLSGLDARVSAGAGAPASAEGRPARMAG